MADLSTIFSQTSSAYQRPEDLDFPVSKIRFFIDILWQAVTNTQLSEVQKVTLKELIDLLNLLDEHKHEPQKELISAMLPSIAPLLEKMPTLGLTGTHVFTHLVPIYQLYLPSIEKMVKDAHPFSLEETMLYYELTIFDHLFLVHIFEQETNQNMIELLLTIKAIILINALVYDYQQHVNGRSISFFTFLMRGGLAADKLSGFLLEAVEYVSQQTKLTVQSTSCIETLEFLKTKLLATTTQSATSETEGEVKEESALTQAFDPATPPAQADQIFADATPLTTEVDTPTNTETPVPAEDVDRETEITPVTTTEPITIETTPLLPTETVAPLNPTETVSPITDTSLPTETTVPAGIVASVNPIVPEPMTMFETPAEVPQSPDLPVNITPEIAIPIAPAAEPPVVEPAMVTAPIVTEVTMPAAEVSLPTTDAVVQPTNVTESMPIATDMNTPIIPENSNPLATTPVSSEPAVMETPLVMPVNNSPLAENPQIKTA